MLTSNDITMIVLLIMLSVIFSGFILAIGKVAHKKFMCPKSDKVSKEYKKQTFDILMQRDDNIFPPGISEKTALDILQVWLLGEDWYVVDPLNGQQVNTEIVYQILYKYSDAFRKEYNLRKKINSLKPYELNPNWKGPIYETAKVEDENE